MGTPALPGQPLLMPDHPFSKDLVHSRDSNVTFPIPPFRAFRDNAVQPRAAASPRTRGCWCLHSSHDTHSSLSSPASCREVAKRLLPVRDDFTVPPVPRPAVEQVPATVRHSWLPSSGRCHWARAPRGTRMLCRLCKQPVAGRGMR